MVRQRSSWSRHARRHTAAWLLAALTTLTTLAATTGHAWAGTADGSQQGSGQTGYSQTGTAETVQGTGHGDDRHGKANWRFDSAAVALSDLARITGADRLWASGVTGRGVGVALVDTGIAPVDGLNFRNVVLGPDLSFEGLDPDLRHLDTYGHGTHLAGIIAGSDTSGSDTSDRAGFKGIAPDATLTSVKVAANDGSVDVSQVIAAIDWVITHRNDDPARPIRVLNLAYGTDGVQDYRLDPLTHAVENAWRAGIVVVAAAGNDGPAASKLTNPAHDPHVLAVGAADPAGTVSTSDDTVLDFSSHGNSSRRVDIVAPGRSVVSLRSPGSFVDTSAPTARVGERYLKGSGTSQAAAVVSGAVALLLQQRPGLTPDQVKGVLTSTARRLYGANAAGQGTGELDLAKAVEKKTPGATQKWAASTGLGSLEAARGSSHVIGDGVELSGENDIFGPFDAAAWARASATGTAWRGGQWMGHDWTGDSWDSSPQAPSWFSRTWSSRIWSSRTWSSRTWSGVTWSSDSWASRTWSSRTWSSRTWSSRTWSGDLWS